MIIWSPCIGDKLIQPLMTEILISWGPFLTPTELGWWVYPLLYGNVMGVDRPNRTHTPGSTFQCPWKNDSETPENEWAVTSWPWGSLLYVGDEFYRGYKKPLFLDAYEPIEVYVPPKKNCQNIWITPCLKPLKMMFKEPLAKKKGKWTSKILKIRDLGFPSCHGWNLPRFSKNQILGYQIFGRSIFDFCRFGMTASLFRDKIALSFFSDGN